MFKLHTKKIGKYALLELSDINTNFSLKVVPEKGACIYDLRLNKQNIYDGYETFDDLEELSWGRGILLAPFPNRMASGKYTFKGIDYQFPINDKETGTALHGFVCDLKFKLVDKKLEDTSASLTLQARYDGHFPYYPFPFVATVVYSLDTNKGLSIDFKINNTGLGEMPVGLGWHPYFCITEKVNDTILTLPHLHKVEIDKSLIPIGKRTALNYFNEPKKIGDYTLDNCFVVDTNKKEAVVIMESDLGKLTYKQSTKYAYLQIFMPPHRKSIALEPMTCNIDAFNNGDGLQVLQKGETIDLVCNVNFVSTENA